VDEDQRKTIDPFQCLQPILFPSSTSDEWMKNRKMIDPFQCLQPILFPSSTSDEWMKNRRKTIDPFQSQPNKDKEGLVLVWAREKEERTLSCFLLLWEKKGGTKRRSKMKMEKRKTANKTQGGRVKEKESGRRDAAKKREGGGREKGQETRPRGKKGQRRGGGVALVFG